MKILALPDHLALALEVLRRLGALDAPKSKRAPARAANHTRRVHARAVCAVPAVPAALLRDEELRLVAPATRTTARHAAAAPRFGRTWAMRAGTGHRAVGRASAPGLWL